MPLEFPSVNMKQGNRRRMPDNGERQLKMYVGGKNIIQEEEQK